MFQKEETTHTSCYLLIVASCKVKKEQVIRRQCVMEELFKRKLVWKKSKLIWNDVWRKSSQSLKSQCDCQRFYVKNATPHWSCLVSMFSIRINVCFAFFRGARVCCFVISWWVMIGDWKKKTQKQKQLCAYGDLIMTVKQLWFVMTVTRTVGDMSLLMRWLMNNNPAYDSNLDDDVDRGVLLHFDFDRYEKYCEQFSDSHVLTSQQKNGAASLLYFYFYFFFSPLVKYMKIKI